MIAIIAGHTLLEFDDVREVGNQFRENGPADIHPLLFRRSANGVQRDFSRRFRLAFSSNRFFPKCCYATDDKRVSKLRKVLYRTLVGNYLCNVGRFEECLAETDRAHALDPGYLIIAVDVGCRLYEARRYDEAISPIQKVLEFNPDFAAGRGCLGQVYEANRRYPEATAELRKAVELSGGAAIYIAALGHAYAVSGQRAEARKQLQKLDELSTLRYVSSFPRALIYAGPGENDRALEWLEQAFQEHSSGMHKLKVDPRLDPLRGDARFTDLMRRVGLTP